MEDQEDNVQERRTVKPHSVARLYKAGTWDTLEKIVCNGCGVEKEKVEFHVYRYTCKQCVGVPVASKTRTAPSKQRLYKNGEWAGLENIICSACNTAKEKSEFKVNRYICMVCSKLHMRELNKKKQDGKYDELQKEYNARYEATPHGMQRRAEYREKQKIQRAAAATTRNVNPMNRLGISLRNRMCEILGTTKLKVSVALQYMGVSRTIMQKWVAYNFAEDMSWENLGVIWKLELHNPENMPMANEKDKYTVLNWRNWAPMRISDESMPVDLKERSVNFLA
jgi:hypothetical protein